MDFSRILGCIALVIVSSAVSTRITLKENGYDGIVIAINPEIEEDPDLIDDLKSMWTNASEYLFVATRNRAYFRSITILVPRSWKNGNYSNSFRGESYASADILVANPNPIFGHFPYTLQYEECGKPGQYIHITPEFVKQEKYEFDTGIKGKVIVHEWAHLRWGVFDEVPTEGYPSFYLAQQSVEATRCPSTLDGLKVAIDYDTFDIKSCEQDQSTLLPKPGCEFVPYSIQPSGLNGSIMSHQYLSSVLGFCHNDTTDSQNLHNTAAPNEQNRLCALRSVWEVMLDSEDFFNGSNPSTSNQMDTTPSFSVVRTPSNRYVLVMDVSGSMRTNGRLLTMQRAASLFVSQYVMDGSYVGLVEFNSNARRLRELTEIENESRGDLRTVIQSTAAGGGTGIGSGILEGLRILGKSGFDGGILIVLSDGGENAHPMVATVYDDVINSGVQMYSIFLDLSGSSANSIMVELSEASGGGWFLTYSSASSSDIIGIFRKLAQSDDGNVSSKIYQVISESITIQAGSLETGSVQIDSSIGNETLFSVTYEQAEPAILIQSPNNCVYATYNDSSLTLCVGNPVHQTDRNVRLITFEIPETAQTGKWNYSITNTNLNQPETYTITVTSKPSGLQIEPIEVESSLALTNITSVTPTILYAKVTQGFSPVIGAKVTAIVTAPTTLPTPVPLELFDNGAGADVRRNDGVYSRYFYQFIEQGRYTVQIKVVNNPTSQQSVSGGSPAAFNRGTLSENGTLEVNPNGLSNLPNTSANGISLTEDFERVESGGSFSYSGPAISPSSDLFGPNKVTDLTVNQVNLTNLENGGVLVSITFTAPGDDLDSGNATRYEIRYSFQNASHLVTNFKETRLVEEGDVVEGSLNSPLPSGSEENIVFRIPNDTTTNTSQIFVALLAYDETGNPSESSNVSPMTLFFRKSALPRIPVAAPTVTEQTVTTEFITNTTKPATESTTESTRQSIPDNYLAYQISVGVLGGLVLVLVVIVSVLVVKLTAVTSKMKTHKRYEPTEAYGNPYG